jgi:hypothetical protein
VGQERTGALPAGNVGEFKPPRIFFNFANFGRRAYASAVSQLEALEHFEPRDKGGGKIKDITLSN